MPRSNYCYVLIPSKNNSIGIVKFGETGYYETDWTEGYSQDYVDELNSNLGLSKEEVEAMHLCSMIKTLNTLKKWEAHYNMVVDSLNRKLKYL